MVTARLWKRGHTSPPEGSGMVCHGRSSEHGVPAKLLCAVAFFTCRKDFAPKNNTQPSDLRPLFNLYHCYEASTACQIRRNSALDPSKMSSLYVYSLIYHYMRSLARLDFYRR